MRISSVRGFIMQLLQCWGVDTALPWRATDGCSVPCILHCEADPPLCIELRVACIPGLNTRPLERAIARLRRFVVIHNDVSLFVNSWRVYSLASVLLEAYLSNSKLMEDLLVPQSAQSRQGIPVAQAEHPPRKAAKQINQVRSVCV